MAVRETITVSITPELRAFIGGPFAYGHHGNASAVVRAGLRIPIDESTIEGVRSPNRTGSRAAYRG